MPSVTALLELTGLSFTLGGRRILDGIDLTVAAGDRHALLGPNGAASVGARPRPTRRSCPWKP